MAKDIKRKINEAYQAARKDIENNSRNEGFYAGGLASEGFAGGYTAALDDVLLALNGVYNQNSRYWPKPDNEEA